jgi:dTDP-glucose 4,6-dehydratase
MRVLLTGGAGFIGHHLLEHLWKNTDWEIVVLDRLDSAGNLNRITDIECFDANKHRLKVVYHNLRASINQSVARNIGPIDIILHLAAASHVNRSISDPMSFVEDNVVGTVNLLQYARGLKNLKTFVNFSTDEVFGPAPDGVSFKEDDRYNSGNPYAASKAAAEEFCVAFHNTYGLPVINTHTMNVFGERQDPEKFVPMTIRKVMAGETVFIHSDQTCTRSSSRFYIHARNVAAAVLHILKHGSRAGEKYNIAGEMELTNLEVAFIIADTLGQKLNYVMVSPDKSDRPGVDMRYALDDSKMKSLGWKIPMPLSESLKSTILWTKNNADKWLI